MIKSLIVSGKSISLKESPNLKPIKSSRKIYDLKFFKESQEYRHEIANHYRDFKNNRQIRKRRRRKSSIKVLRKFSDDFYNYREVLQIPCFIFPRFTEVFPWRGRNTLCDQIPPYIYNHTIQRINDVQSLDDLKYLIERQEYLWARQQTISNYPPNKSLNPLISIFKKHATNLKNQEHYKQQQKEIRPLTVVNVKKLLLLDFPILKNYKNSINTSKNINNNNKRDCRNRHQQNLGYVISEEERLANSCSIFATSLDPTVNNSCNIERKYKNKSKNNSVNANDGSSYCYTGEDDLIQLASDCYDEGLQSHLYYLESVTEKSAINQRKRQQQLQLYHQNFPESDSGAISLNRSRPESSCILSDKKSKISDEEYNNIDNNNGGKLYSAIKRVVDIRKPLITNKRCRKIHIRTYDENFYPKDDCHIRVDITNASNQQNQLIKENRKNIKEFSNYKRNQFQNKNSIERTNSMSEFLPFNGTKQLNNFNTELNIKSNNNFKNSNYQTINTTSREGESRTNVNELINSLCHLDINDINNTLLPKIILTDFSSQETSANSTPIITPSSSSNSTIGAKHFNFDLNDIDGRLNIPNDLNYRSEARPP